MTLERFFEEHKKIAVAFSGGVDSAYLLYEALRCGAEVKAYYIKSSFQPAFELADAVRLAEELDADMRIIKKDILSCGSISENQKDRCYFCKKEMFSEILKVAAEDGFYEIADGTNASDAEDDRPGMRAIKELRIYSPLRLAGLEKNEIRRLSKAAGLFTWGKPAYACLATRIAVGEEITEKKLSDTQAAEEFLSKLGFSDFRVRYVGGNAKLEVREEQLSLLFEHREEIVTELKKYYKSVLLDLGTVRKSAE